MPDLIKIYKILLKFFGPQKWWPGSTPFEVVIGAILTQSCSWSNVEQAIKNLKKEKILSPKGLYNVKTSKLQKLIRPSGYFRAKAKKVKAFVNYLMREYEGKVGKMREKQGGELREELLSIHGIGPETADSILLYALEKPSFVVDAYTIRIGQRLKLFRTSKYHEVKEFFENDLPKNVKLFNEFHALFVALGKDYCKKKKPRCETCPLSKTCK